METFLIQTIKGEVWHDFSFYLMESLKYHAWLNQKETFRLIYAEEINPSHKGCIPIGTLEFVFSYMERFEGVKKENITPINVPASLMAPIFLKREAWIKKKEDIVLTKPHFLKSATSYKVFTDVVEELKEVPDDTYFVSEVVNIKSEWRSFVHRGSLVGLHNYSGDFTAFPCVTTLKEMIKAYQGAPISYTLDIGVNDSGTFVIEVHPFVSCGLYGFNEYKILPFMFISAYKEMLKQCK